VRLSALFCAALLCSSALGATLERLSLEQMAQFSTSVIRGRVESCGGEARGSRIFTRCRITVSDWWKGSGASQADVWIPGGQAQGLSQTFSGTPRLTVRQEYLLFLWSGRSGLAQVIGLSQGAFDLRADTKGETYCYRSVSQELMVDEKGKAVADQRVEIRLQDLKQVVMKSIATSGSSAR